MRITRLTQPDERSTFQRRFEYILLAIVLCIVACRCTHTETLTSSGISILIDYISVSQSLTFSILLITIAVLWFVVNLIRGEFVFRISGFASGLIVFTIAAGISTFFASDSRASINSFLTIAGCVVTGIFMVQMLKRISTIRFVVIIVAALAVVNCYESMNQLTTSNDYMIEQYQENPQAQLGLMGIEANTLQSFLYEHRLYSKDIKGYFTTGNSLGSFLLLTGFTTIGLLAGKVKRYIKTKQGLVDMVIISVILLAQIACFFAATSKGAAGAAIVGITMLVLWIFFRKVIAEKRYTLFGLIAFGGGFIIVVIMAYAARTASLPGGNSMMVRAEYWFATARMIAGNFFSGVGGGNFGYHYTAYKLPASIETVLDPHNMLLSMASQYGILGLAGFVLIIFLPLTKIIVPKFKTKLPVDTLPQDTSSQNKWVKYAIAAFIALTMFIVRPFLIPINGTDDTGVMIYIITVMYAAPALIFLFIVWLTNKAVGDDLDIEYLQAAMFCGIVAMLIHNLIDFAIFEPGVMSMLFLITACFVSISKYRLNRFGWLVRLDKPDAIVISTITVAALVTVVWLGYVPVLKATSNLKDAFSTKTLEMSELIQASKSDPFESKMFPFIARVLWSEYDSDKNRDNLILAEKYFSMAIKKNPADFKNYKNLAKVRWEMADNTRTYKRKELLEGSGDAYRMAINRYPGKAELHLELGKILFLQNKPQEANQEFGASLIIEDMFREKFVQMYPDAEPVSRIKPEEYEFLKGVVESTPDN